MTPALFEGWGIEYENFWLLQFPVIQVSHDGIIDDYTTSALVCAAAGLAGPHPVPSLGFPITAPVATPGRKSTAKPGVIPVVAPPQNSSAITGAVATMEPVVNTTSLEDTLAAVNNIINVSSNAGIHSTISMTEGILLRT